MRFSKEVKGYEGQNPFSDSQARNFSDIKVISEFCPISNFWSLFNDQHEILLGTRGSGKTFLLKMMRFSMLKKIPDPRAEQLICEKKFIALYVPMHLEFVTPFNSPSLFPEKQMELFQFAFNCFLAESLITELNALLDDFSDNLKKAQKMLELAEKLDEIWFIEDRSEDCNLTMLSNKIDKLFYTIDWTNANLDKVPPVFKRQICSSLLSVKTVVAQILELKEEPTWIVCIDEAEFLNETLQKCINNVFRSDSNRIALKVATLPFFHKTLETLEPNVMVSDGNDFCYRVVDMPYDNLDFVNLTNKLCQHRLKTRFRDNLLCESLEEFLGVVGKDRQIDYYREEMKSEGKEEEGEQSVIIRKIMESFPEKRREHANNYNNPRKSIYDKYAPIFFVREMCSLSNKGNHKPGWYAGANIVRKVSQGNPRIFIQIMSELFEKAKKTELSPKVQHEVIMKFAVNYCEATQALELQGPIVYKNLNQISGQLHAKVHDGNLVSSGSAFVLGYRYENDFSESKKWIELAVAYSRVIVDDEVKKSGIKKDTKYILANAYAVANWLPIRADAPVKISISNNMVNSYIVKTEKQKLENVYQLSLFEEDKNDYI